MVKPFEQGRLRGLLEKDAIHFRLNEVRKLLDFMEMDLEDLLRLRSDRLKYVPERFLEECRGIAEGAGVRFEEILFLDFGLVFEQIFKFECTAFAIPRSYSVDGSIMLLKNRDLGFRRFHPQVLAYSNIDGYNRFLGVVSAGSVCWYQGVNEKGLIAFNTATPSEIIDPVKAQGMGIAILIRRILEECDDVDEALKLVFDFGGGVSSNLFLADYNRIVVVELKAGLTPYVWEIKEPDCRANHYLLHVNPEPKEPLEVLTRNYTLLRYARGKMLLKGKEKIGVDDLVEFSRDHFNGPGPASICRHPPMVGSPLVKLLSSTTLSAQIFKVGEGIEVYTALGYPCQTNFIHTVFGGDIPIEASSGVVWLTQYKRKCKSNID
ncbi:MAG: C45 family peptidase [Candidatus Methanomethylicia archaeon]